MKKSLLFAAALFASVAVNAQTVWTFEAESVEDLTGLNGTSSEATLTVSPATLGEGLYLKAVKPTYKDASGTATPYCESGKSLYSITPTNKQIEVEGKMTTENQYRNIEGAVTNNMIVRMPIAIVDGNTTDYIKITSVGFEATRVGTDAVRLNVRIVGEGDNGPYTSDWLINADNWATVSDGTGAWKENSADGIDGGCMPARDDASKDFSAPTGRTVYKIPAPADMPADLYEATVEIAIYGISDNKNALLHNVTINHSATDGINDIKANAENVNAPAYNMAGQRVNSNFKGLMIQNGKKFINK